MIEIKGINILILSILAYFLGDYITKKSKILHRLHIPVGLLGGISLCIIFYFITKYTNKNFVFDTELRNFFLLFFFCTTGMLANVNELAQGGKMLAKLVIVLCIFLILQNTVGIICAKILGVNLVNGLIMGTITLAGGHGTAISWGNYLEQLGYTGSLDLGLIGATLGLIMGSIIGGPVSGSLIRKYSLENKSSKVESEQVKNSDNELFKIVSSTPLFLKTIFFILLIMVIGRAINKFLLNPQGIVCPEYLPTMLIAVLFALCINKQRKIILDKKKISLLNNMSLQIFITMAIMTINLKFLFHTRILEVLFILFFQVIFIILFAKFIFFKLGGKNYDSAVLTAGFIGAGLGATPVGLANMDSITKKYGISVRAFLLLPLLGSVFTDSMNAIILSIFLNFIK